MKGNFMNNDQKRTGEALKAWIKGYARPMRGKPNRFIVDEFDTEFYIILDCEDDPESPESNGLCDVLIVPLIGNGETVRLKANCDKYGIMRIFAALGIGRFNIKVKTAFYEMSNPLR